MNLPQKKGIDFSQYQGMQYDEDISDYEFLIHRLGQGLTFKDKEVDRRVKMFAPTKPVILYFVLNSTDIPGQIYQCAKLFNAMEYKHGMGIALDIENDPKYFPTSVKEGVLADIISGAHLLRDLTDKRVIIYCGGLYAKEFYRAIRAYDFGLWICKWSNNRPDIPCDFWQYTNGAGDKNRPYDKDYFFGDDRKFSSFFRDLKNY